MTITLESSRTVVSNGKVVLCGEWVWITEKNQGRVYLVSEAGQITVAYYLQEDVKMDNVGILTLSPEARIQRFEVFEAGEITPRFDSAGKFIRWE